MTGPSKFCKGLVEKDELDTFQLVNVGGDSPDHTHDLDEAEASLPTSQMLQLPSVIERVHSASKSGKTDHVR